MFRKMPFILIALILAMVLFEPFLPLQMKSILYGLSLSIQSLIVFLLPFLIFGLLFKVAANLTHHATKVILLILGGVCLSNFLSTLTSYSVGVWVYDLDVSLLLPQASKELEPAWTFFLPKLIPNQIAMFSGLILGVLASLFLPKKIQMVSGIIEKGVGKILSAFALLIPLFVAGFVIKLQHEGIVLRILQDYSLIFVVITLSLFTYISFIYFVANFFHPKKVLRNLKNMLPAALAGFSTMSSAAAMPLTILGTKENARNADLVQSIIPATVNIHLMGDCFAIPIFAFAVLKNYGIAEPSFEAYLLFAFYFVLAKFSVAAVPGGGILVMLPILESYLGFNAEMMSLITALYILFDPVITSANVLGNGGFALLIDKVYAFFPRFQRKLDFSRNDAYK